MIASLANPIELSPGLVELHPFDGNALFLCHASYEPRAYKVTAENLAQLNITAAAVVATTSSIKTNSQYAECYTELKRRLCVLAKTPTIGIEAGRDDLVGLVTHLHARLTESPLENVRNVIVDATVFPKDRLWMVLDYIKQAFSHVRLFVLYVEPDAYNTEVVESGWLSKGVKSIGSIPRFNGHQSAQKRALLVIVVGHEQERMQITIKNTEADKVVLIGQGLQQHSEAAPNLATIIVKHLGQDYAHVVDTSAVYSVGSRDYLGVNTAVTAIYERFSKDYNIIVAANGTKLQSLGAMLACQANRAITAIYAEPQIYNNNEYSTGAGKTWGILL